MKIAITTVGILLLAGLGGCHGKTPLKLSSGVATHGDTADDNSYPVQRWHRATQEECNAEDKRELHSMGELGLYGDPPITVGEMEFSASIGGKDTDIWDHEPCGYADDSYPPRFRSRYTHFIRHGSIGKETEVSEKQYYNHFNSIGRAAEQESAK